MLHLVGLLLIVIAGAILLLAPPFWYVFAIAMLLVDILFYLAAIYESMNKLAKRQP